MSIPRKMRNSDRKRGFTIIEMLVAVTLFAIIMVMAVGAVLSVVNANRRAQSAKSVLNNLNFAMDHMVRNIRTGTTYRCWNERNHRIRRISQMVDNPRSCEDGGILLGLEKAFGNTNSPADQLIYRYFRPVGGTGTILFSNKGTNTIDEDDWVYLTPPEVVVESLRFYVEGAERGDGKQPRVTIVLQGYVETTSKARTDFNLQTTVTQRVFDI